MPTVAREAKVSRGTVYRFFTNQELLLGESLHEFTLGLPIVRASYRELEKPDDPDARIRLLCELAYETFARNESSFRTFLRYTLEKGDSPPSQRRLRGRFLWIDMALEPVTRTMRPEKLSLLRIQLASQLGIEAFIAYVDVCQLTVAEAKIVATETCIVCLKQALSADDAPIA